VVVIIHWFGFKCYCKGYVFRPKGNKATCYSAAYICQDLQLEVLYSLRSCSWLAWANDTV